MLYPDLRSPTLIHSSLEHLLNPAGLATPRPGGVTAARPTVAGWRRPQGTPLCTTIFFACFRDKSAISVWKNNRIDRF